MSAQVSHTPIARGQQFKLEELSATERAQALRCAALIKAAAIKGLLHRYKEAEFKLEPNPKSIEMIAAVAAHQMDAQTFAKIVPRLAELHKNPSRLQQITDLPLVEFRKAGAVKLPPLSAPPPMQAMSGSQTHFSRLDLNLRALHCVDETNPEGGADSMVLGAIRIGASGNVDYSKAIVAGKYNDGTYHSFGELYFGSVSLKSTNYWPKTFYWIFLLTESDSDDKEVAAGITNALAFVVTIVAGYFSGGSLATLAGGIINAIGGVVQIFMDEDQFPPYGVVIKLKSEKDFGSDHVKDEHTGDIRGHGGTYRIGYRLRLA